MKLLTWISQRPGPAVIVPVMFWMSAAPWPACAQKVRLRQLWATGTVVEGDSVRITGMAQSPTGEVWISDGNAGRVIILSAEGTFVRFAGFRGEKAGGFEAPRLIARMNEHEMGVLDVGRSTVEVFGIDGQWKRQIRLALQLLAPKGFVVRDNRILVSAGTFSKDGCIHEFDAAGRWIRSWGGFPAPKDRTIRGRESAMDVAGGPLAVDDDLNLIYSQAAPHRIIRYADGEPTDSNTVASESGLLRDVVDEFKVTKQEDGKTRTTFRWFFDQSRGLVTLGGRFIINAVTFEDQRKTLWQVYDEATGELVSSIATPGNYWLWRATKEGDLLATLWLPAMSGSSAVRLRLEWDR